MCSITSVCLPKRWISKRTTVYREIAREFRLKCNSHLDLKNELIDLIERSRSDIFILITDFENDSHLEDFAKLMRAVLDKSSENFKMITIGGKKLEALKTKEGIHSYWDYFERTFV